MSVARSCGATFNRVAETRRAVMHALTVVKPEHGTIIGPGIQCGSLGSECSAEHPEAAEITLKAYADDGYAFRGFTGDCLRNGDTVMNAPRRCAATFVQRASASATPLPPTGGGGGGGGSARSSGSGSGSGGRPTQETQDPLDGRRPTSPPLETPDGGAVGGGGAKPAASPESIAKDDIQKMLEAYRLGYEALDPERIKRVYPNAPVNSLRNTFRDYRALEYTYTGPPEFVDLDPALGTATVKIVARFAPQYKGPKMAPQTLLNVFTLVRSNDVWTVRAVAVTQK
jgi:hypothetical protein